MQTRDIQIGKEYCVSGYYAAKRARVLETGLPVGYGSRKRNIGVRVALLDMDGEELQRRVVQSRDIDRPWTEKDTERVRKATREREMTQALETNLVEKYDLVRAAVRLRDGEIDYLSLNGKAVKEILAMLLDTQKNF